MRDFREKVSIGENTFYGSWLNLASPAIAELMASSGLDFVAIDMEHSATTYDQALTLIRTIEQSGSRPFVRVSCNNKIEISRIMDMGAHGIIVPNINSKADILKAQDAMYFPPKGTRGVGLSRAQDYGASFQKNYQWANQESYFVIQIENCDALNNLDEIFSSEGVDAYMVGPYDLSASLGIPGQFQEPKFQDALKQIEQSAQKYGLPAGIHQVEPDMQEVHKLVQSGYRFIVYSVDFMILQREMERFADNFISKRGEN